MNRCLFVFALVAVSTPSLLADETAAAADQVLSIWPNSPPAWNAPSEPERDTTGADGREVSRKRVIRLGFVSEPQLHVFLPKNKNKASETAVLVCPGGGYSILAWDLEGTELAEWLAGLGVTAIVVKYRVPTRSDEQPWRAPVQDIQRGISMVRSGAIEGVAPKRIGVLGFSAGGNASARTALATGRHYEPIDKHDQASPTPDFAVLVYPAWLTEKEAPGELIEDLVVDENSPPMFFAHAADDRITCLGSVTLFSHLKRHNVPASLHVFASGGHGFGARAADKPTDAWPGLCETWMRRQGLLE